MANHLENVLEIHYFKKGELLLREGRICERLWFLRRGLVIGYRTKSDQKKVRSVSEASDIIPSVRNLYEQTLMLESFESAAFCITVSILRKDLERVHDLFPETRTLSMKILDLHQQQLLLFINRFKVGSSKKRYAYLVNTYPHWLVQLHPTVLASIIDIHVRTWYRLRKTKKL